MKIKFEGGPLDGGEISTEDPAAVVTPNGTITDTVLDYLGGVKPQGVGHYRLVGSPPAIEPVYIWRS